MITWPADSNTQSWAAVVRPNLPPTPHSQFAGNYLRVAHWAAAGRLGPGFPPAYVLPAGCVLSSPSNIVKCFTAGLHLEAIALTTVWGLMTKTTPKIYAAGSPAVTAGVAAVSTLLGTPVVHAAAIAAGFATLTGAPLNWSPIMTSKVLHFLARACAHLSDPPVPFDRAVSVGCVWPAFLNAMRALPPRLGPGVPVPKQWTLDWSGYQRYMTAITTWSAAAGWTTTDIEATIFAICRGLVHRRTCANLF